MSTRTQVAGAERVQEVRRTADAQLWARLRPRFDGNTRGVLEEWWEDADLISHPEGPTAVHAAIADGHNRVIDLLLDFRAPWGGVTAAGNLGQPGRFCGSLSHLHRKLAGATQEVGLRKVQQ